MKGIFFWGRRKLKRRKSTLWRLDSEGKRSKREKFKILQDEMETTPPPNWRIHNHPLHITTPKKKKNPLKKSYFAMLTREGALEIGIL